MKKENVTHKVGDVGFILVGQEMLQVRIEEITEKNEIQTFCRDDGTRIDHIVETRIWYKVRNKFIPYTVLQHEFFDADYLLALHLVENCRRL